MRPTRRGWAALGLSAFLAGFALLLSTPLPLIGAILIGTWAVIRGHALTSAVSELQQSLTITQSVDAESIHPGANESIELSAAREVPPHLALTVSGGPPASADRDHDLLLSLTNEQSQAEITTPARWPIAGSHSFQPPAVTVTDGLFRHTFSQGSAPTIRVEAPSIRDIHVGAGGNRIRASYGEHKAHMTGSGIEPATIRPAHLGDPASHIDWKATARLGEPHVREFEIEIDRETLLVADCRESMDEGRPGSTKLDLLKSVLLTIAESAAGFGDPLGVLVVDETGCARQVRPGSTDTTYQSVRQTLETLRIEGNTKVIRSREPDRAISATRRLAALGTDHGTFAQTLRPYFRARSSYRRRFESDSLFGTIHTATSQTNARQWVIIATDDSRPDALRETVAMLRGDGHLVSCYLAPSVLYADEDDLDAAFTDYETFESLRRELAAIPGVQAFEVGPKDRLGKIIGVGRTRRLEATA